jgi:thimet oligopeptidase
MWDRIPGFAMAALTSFALMAGDASHGSAAAAGAGTDAKTAGPLRTVADFQAAAARNQAVLALPKYERTPAELEASAKAVIAEANRDLDALAAQVPAKATFSSTVAALDNVLYAASNAASRIYLLKEVEPEAALRAAATTQSQALQEWAVSVTYREDVFKAVKAFADAYEAGQRPRLEGEDLKLYRDTMRDYRRAGLTLDKPTRDKVEALQKQLSRLSTDFEQKIGQAKATVTFTKDELEGVPDAFLASVKTADERYVVLANVTPQYQTVAMNAKREATRKRLEMARSTLAQTENGPLLNEIVSIRDQIAPILGYSSWADYQIEPRMARTEARATAFLEDLKKGLDPKFQAELAQYRALKVRDTGDPAAKVEFWDWRYYENQLKKEKYSVDTDGLRVFFPFDKVRAGMFEIYERIFGLKFEQVQNPDPWYRDVELYVASDAATLEPLGLFYLDNFPREGKFNHFAQFGIVKGRRLPDGRYQRPVVALVCNFPAPTSDQPSLLSHREVEVLFHEFGHALHSLLTRARYAEFSGTSVPQDFVEAPSQMLENWAWDAGVLNRFASDYRDPSKKIDPALLARMKEAKLATSGTFYRRQLALALSDLALHRAPKPGQPKDAQAILNGVFGDVFIPLPEGTHFGAYWGHLTGYDAGYYGYLWAEAIAADMASVFEKAPQGFLDATVGRRLRDEVYAAGDSRDINESIRLFLERDRSNAPFLKHVGLD